MVLNVLAAVGFLGYALLLWRLIDKHRSRGNSEFSLSMLPSFPKSCKLYYEQNLERLCKRCTAAGKSSSLVIRRRYLLFKDANGVLKVKDLTHVYNCATCGYKGLYLTKASPEKG